MPMARQSIPYVPASAHACDPRGTYLKGQLCPVILIGMSTQTKKRMSSDMDRVIVARVLASPIDEARLVLGCLASLGLRAVRGACRRHGAGWPWRLGGGFGALNVGGRRFPRSARLGQGEGHSQHETRHLRVRVHVCCRRHSCRCSGAVWSVHMHACMHVYLVRPQMGHAHAHAHAPARARLVWRPSPPVRARLGRSRAQWRPPKLEHSRWR